MRKKTTRLQASPRKSTKSTPKKPEQHVLRERSANTIAATPSKSNKDGKHLQLPDLPVVPEEEPTPACVRMALGPTPQKDGAVLSIFDMLSAGTPSKGPSGIFQAPPEALVAGTPTKSKVPSSSDANLSRTPQSSSKRYYLDAFAGTPLKRKRQEDHGTPSTAKKLFATPSFLQRHWPLSRINEDDEESKATGPQRKKRPLVRSLSTIIQGLKKQEEQRMDDDWDVLNEIEAEERGETAKPAPAKVFVEDSQAQEAEMPLGPDQGVESSEDEGGKDAGALDAEGKPRKVWKKKGLKRQTRRVIMRPVMRKSETAPGALGSGRKGEQSWDDAEVVEETQVPAPAGRLGEDSDFEDEAGRDDSQQSRHEKRPAKKQDAEKGKEKKTKAKKFRPEAHANYRKLKIKNKNSKANGRGGRFGRR